MIKAAQIRRKKGVSAQEVAVKLGVPTRDVLAWEKREVIPNKRELELWGRVIGVGNGNERLLDEVDKWGRLLAVMSVNSGLNPVKPSGSDPSTWLDEEDEIDEVFDSEPEPSGTSRPRPARPAAKVLGGDEAARA